MKIDSFGIQSYFEKNSHVLRKTRSDFAVWKLETRSARRKLYCSPGRIKAQGRETMNTEGN